MRSGDICQAMLKFSLKFPQNQLYDPLKLEHFTDGLPFAHMLIPSDTISLSLTELEQNSSKWITKVSNLKKILTKIHNFLELVNEKTQRIKDIDVVQIAKNSSVQHIAKFFEVVVSVLMNSAEKEKYIQLIMTLDEHSQNTFVEIIQNSLDQQLFPSQQNSNIFQMEEELTQLRRENASLKVELNEVVKKYKGLQREVNQLREKVMNFQYEEERAKGSELGNNQGLLSQLQQQRVLIDNLKLKLLSTVRENQIELSQLREEVSLLQLKTKNMEDLEATLEQYKEMYNQNLNDQQKLIQLEKDKRRLTRQIEEKDQTIKKLQGKIQTTIEKNYSMQENELYMKLELEKREARFKQLEKEVKIRLKSQPSEITPRVADIDPQQEEKEELLYLQDQLNKSKIALKELEKESIKNRKRLERMSQLELQKKKLEKIIVEVNRSKDMEIELLVVSLYQLRNENIKIFEMLKSVTQSRTADKRT